jgi:glyoxylase-like metal-dependent hydrolase (beta-lactamase superfamily II)
VNEEIRVLIECIEADLFGTNCFVVAAGPGEQCIVVDPGIGVTRGLDEVIAEHRLHPVAVVLTHGHLDHTFSVLPVCQARDVPAYIHPDDRHALADPWSLMGLPPGTPLPGVGSLTAAEPDDVRALTDGALVQLAGLDLTVRHAPGHTRGSILIETPAAGDQAPVAFTGDVLFAGSIGRTDLPGGSMPAMLDSLKNVILPMPDEVLVCPGHGPRTTIGAERATNPYLRELT